MLLDANNYKSGDTGYQPGQQFRNSYKDNPLNDDDSYASVNPAQFPELTDDDSYQSNNAGSSLELDDSDSYQSVNPGQDIALDDTDSYESVNKDKLGASEYVNTKPSGRLRQKIGNSIVNKLGNEAGVPAEMMNLLNNDTPENREQLKARAKELARNEIKNQARKHIKSDGFNKQIENGLGRNAKDILKDAAGFGKKMGNTKNVQVLTDGGKAVQRGKRLYDEGKNAAKLAKGAKNIATAAKGAKNVATAAEGLEGAIALVGAASGPETLGLGTIAAFLLDVAISLGIEDAVDCLFELKEGHISKAKFHAEKAYMSVQMFVWFLIGIVFSISVTGFIIGVPIMVALTIYALLGIIFPGVGLLQGLSRNWELAILFIVDLFLFIIVLTFVAGVLWYICDQSGLGGGNAAALISKVIDWWNGTQYASMLNEGCQSIRNFK